MVPWLKPLAVVLIFFWFIGFALHILGDLIHFLLVLAVIVLVLELFFDTIRLHGGSSGR